MGQQAVTLLPGRANSSTGTPVVRDNSHRLQLNRFKLDVKKKPSSAKGWCSPGADRQGAGRSLSAEVFRTLKVLGGRRQPAVVLATVVLCAEGWIEACTGSYPFVFLSYCEILLPWGSPGHAVLREN